MHLCTTVPLGGLPQPGMTPKRATHTLQHRRRAPTPVVKQHRGALPQDARGKGSLTSRSDDGVAITRLQAPPGVGYDWPLPSARPRTPGRAVSSGWAHECGPSVWPPQDPVPKEGQLRATGVGNGAHGSRGMRKDGGQLAEGLLQARTGRRRPGMGRGLAKAGGHGRTWEPSRP